MVGENFKFYFSEVAKNAFSDKNRPPWLEKILKFTLLKWLKMHFSDENRPPLLEKNFKFTFLK